MNNGIHVEMETLRVLLIEDSPSDRRLTEIALEEAATEARRVVKLETASSLREGIEKLTVVDGHFDAALLDLGLPDAAGLEGLRATRTASPDVPIVVLTGLTDPEVATEALNSGASDYLDKDEIEPRPLLRSIRYAIERKRSEGELLRLAQTDPLTGCLNRRAFFEQLDLAMTQADRSHGLCAVLLFDIDDFKQVNDTHGHVVGDRLLQKIATITRSKLRRTDRLGRIGGDEFAVVAYPISSPAAALKLADRIVTALSRLMEVDGQRIRPNVSAGIALYPEDGRGRGVDEIVSYADAAMYRSKSQRRGGISFYDSEMDAAAKSRQKLKSRMLKAISEDGFFLHYQPIVDVRSGRMIAAEALARWRDENGEPIPPLDFIPVAEESGMIGDLCACLVRQLGATLADWRRSGLTPVPVSINVSPVQCREPDFGPQLAQEIEKAGCPPGSINIELTESSVIDDLSSALTNLTYLRGCGIGIHLDDFGTGYSSLSVLKRLPLDRLKIDRSFVKDLGEDEGADAILDAVVDLARRLDLETVVEGVENRFQLDRLRDMGVEHVQGFYCSRPVDHEAFEMLLARGEPLFEA